MPSSHRLYPVFFFLACLLLAACSSSSKPETSVEAFYQAAIKRDVDKALGYLAMGEMSENELFQAKGKVQMIVGEIAENIEENDGLKRMEVLASEVEEDGEKARVQVKFIYNNDNDHTQSFHLQREDGQWKIILGAGGL